MGDVYRFGCECEWRVGCYLFRVRLTLSIWVANEMGKCRATLGRPVCSIGRTKHTFERQMAGRGKVIWRRVEKRHLRKAFDSIRATWWSRSGRSRPRWRHRSICRWPDCGWTCGSVRIQCNTAVRAFLCANVSKREKEELVDVIVKMGTTRSIGSGAEKIIKV